MASGKRANSVGYDFQLELDRAKAKLVIQYPFLASILLKLKIEINNECPSLGATNGTHVYINQKFCEEMKVSNEQLLGLLAHEVWHIALLHPVRLENRNPQKWNYACDHCVNEMLLKNNFKIPDGGVYFPEFEKLSAEEVYAKLSDPPSDWQSIGVVLGVDGAHAKELEAEIKQAVAAAMAAAKTAGKLPSGIEEVIEGQLYPAIPWYDLLRNYLSITFADGFTWEKPCKRYVKHGVYLPTRKTNRRGLIGVLLDTSGSMTEEELRIASTELSSIIQDCNADALVIHFDSKVQKVEQLNRDDLPITLKAKGRGGTDFKPPFQYLKDNDVEPDAIICITDMECSSFPEDPGIPTFWIRTGRYGREAPFGTVIDWKEAS